MEQPTHASGTDHPEWNESYYFCFSDNYNDIRGMSRLGFKPNKTESSAFFFLFLPGGSAAGYHDTEEEKNYVNPFQAGDLIHRFVDNGKRWKYEYEGVMIKVADPLKLPLARENPELITGIVDVEMDLDFKPLSEVYEYSEHMTVESRELGKKAGDKHWEQVGTVSGLITVDQEEFQLKKIMGQRDHTYGIRDWTGIGNWLYYVVWFDENLAINPAAIIADDGRLSTGGFIFKDGKNIPLRTIKIIDQQFKEGGIIPSSSELEIIDAAGEKHVLKGWPGQVIPVPFKDRKGNVSFLIQSFGSFELDGIAGGYGSFETLRKKP